MSDEEKIVTVDENIVPAEEHKTDEHEPDWNGRCRIYNSSREKIGCKNVSSEDACASWARYKGAYAYGWAPYKECDN